MKLFKIITLLCSIFFINGCANPNESVDSNVYQYSIDEPFEDDSLIVEIKNEVLRTKTTFEPSDFPEIEILYINDMAPNVTTDNYTTSSLKFLYIKLPIKNKANVLDAINKISKNQYVKCASPNHYGESGGNLG